MSSQEHVTFFGNDVVGMVFAGTALECATHRTIGRFRIRTSAARSSADVVLTDDVAAAYDHATQLMVLRMICNPKNESGVNQRSIQSEKKLACASRSFATGTPNNESPPTTPIRLKPTEAVSAFSVPFANAALNASVSGTVMT